MIEQYRWKPSQPVTAMCGLRWRLRMLPRAFAGVAIRPVSGRMKEPRLSHRRTANSLDFLRDAGRSAIADRKYLASYAGLIQNVWREQSSATRQALLSGRRPRSTSIVSDPAAKSRARPWLGRRTARAARRSNHRMFLQPCRHCLAPGCRFASCEQRPKSTTRAILPARVRSVSTGPSACSRTPVIACGGAFALSAAGFAAAAAGATNGPPPRPKIVNC